MIYRYMLACEDRRRINRLADALREAGFGFWHYLPGTWLIGSMIHYTPEDLASILPLENTQFLLIEVQFGAGAFKLSDEAGDGLIDFLSNEPARLSPRS